MKSYNSLCTIRRQFESAVQSVVDDIACYSSDPIADFSRNRKLPARILIPLIIQMGSASLPTELANFFDDPKFSVTASAFCQQRSKLDPEAFLHILHLMSFSRSPSLLKGYRVLAMDGSDVNIPFDPDDEETLCQTGSARPFSQLHLNALYDCLNDLFLDVSIDSSRKTGECAALKRLIRDHRYPARSIICADRGFENYELFAFCIENGQKFVIRCKDIRSNGILSTFELPDSEFDQKIKRILTRKQTNEVKEHPELYKYFAWNINFEYMPKGGAEEYPIEFRVVRIEVKKGEYECLITNLPPEEFSLDDLKELYHLRWNEEVGFRKLKYTIGMLDFHSKKRKFIRQEIYGALTLHNLAALMIHAVPIEQKKDKKYEYKANFSIGTTNIKKFLKRKIGARELEERIKKGLIPIRPDRCYKRNMRAQRVHAFQHRPA